MAMRQSCDVFGTVRGIKNYGIAIVTSDSDGQDKQKVVFEITADLCPRALERLKKKIQAGITEPPQKGRKAKETNDDQA